MGISLSKTALDVGASPEAALEILNRRQAKLYSALSDHEGVSWLGFGTTSSLSLDDPKCLSRICNKANGLIFICLAYDGCPMQPPARGVLGCLKTVLDAYLQGLWALETVKVFFPPEVQANMERLGLDVMPRVIHVAQRLYGPKSAEVGELLLGFAGRLCTYSGKLGNWQPLATRLAEDALKIFRECKPSRLPPCPLVQRMYSSPFDLAGYLCTSASPAVRAHRDAVTKGWSGATALATGLSSHLDALLALSTIACLTPSATICVGADKSALPAAKAHLEALEVAYGPTSPHLWEGYVSMMFATWKFGEGEADPAMEWANMAMEALQKTGMPHVGGAEVLELVAEICMSGYDDVRALRAAEKALAVRRQVGADLYPNKVLRAYIKDAARSQRIGGGAESSGSFSIKFRVGVTDLFGWGSACSDE
jgi:hypothetical protein